MHELDASTIVFLLGLKPGHIVCESGTGSGAMSTTILRTIKPTGHLNTFEFNKVRAEMAAIEFKSNGLEDLVTVRHRDGILSNLIFLNILFSHLFLKVFDFCSFLCF